MDISSAKVGAGVGPSLDRVGPIPGRFFSGPDGAFLGLDGMAPEWAGPRTEWAPTQTETSMLFMQVSLKRNDAFGGRPAGLSGGAVRWGRPVAKKIGK